jgi:hypothetical protein
VHARRAARINGALRFKEALRRNNNGRATGAAGQRGRSIARRGNKARARRRDRARRRGRGILNQRRFNYDAAGENNQRRHRNKNRFHFLSPCPLNPYRQPSKKESPAEAGLSWGDPSDDWIPRRATIAAAVGRPFITDVLIGFCCSLPRWRWSLRPRHRNWLWRFLDGTRLRRVGWRNRGSARRRSWLRTLTSACRVSLCFFGTLGLRLEVPRKVEQATHGVFVSDAFGEPPRAFGLGS